MRPIASIAVGAALAVLATTVADSAAASAGGARSPEKPQDRYASTSDGCKATLAASYGSLGKGTEIVRRLYPAFDPGTFVVRAEQPLTLLDCDFAPRPKPSRGVAVVLKFPSQLLLDNDLQIGALDAIRSEFVRIEIAEVAADADGKVRVARNRDALTLKAVARDRDVMPVRGAHLDRTRFALSENETAVAVRFGLDTACAGHGALLFEYDDLALFRAHGEDLRLVLEVTLSLTTTQVHCDEAEDGCGGSDTEKHILRRGKHKTGGLFDWVYKNVTHPKADPPATYRWNGSEYVEAAAAIKRP